MTQVALPWMPIFSSIEPQETRVARARIAVGVEQEFRHDEQRDALDAFRRALDAGQHQMDDVVGQVVLAGRDEDLLAGDRCSCRRPAGPPWCAAGRDRCRNAARSGSSCRSRRPRPASAGRSASARREPCTRIAAIAPWVRPAYIMNAMLAETMIFADRRVHGIGQALAAIFGRRRKAHPAALAVLRVGAP